MAEITRKRQGQLVAGAFGILLSHPEGMPAGAVLKALRSAVPPTEFEAADYPNRPGVPRYEKIVRFSTIPFVKAGWLVKTKGTWALTDSGIAEYKKLAADPEKFMRSAVAQYKVWKKGQAAAEDSHVDVDAEEPVVASLLEEAEEAAFAEIKVHLQKIDPYDFQHLVAALITAMGYSVQWIAPPGPDRGLVERLNNGPTIPKLGKNALD